MSLILSVSCSCNWELWEYMLCHIRGTTWVSSIEIFLTFLLKASFPPPGDLCKLMSIYSSVRWRRRPERLWFSCRFFCLSLLICYLLHAYTIWCEWFFTLACHFVCKHQLALPGMMLTTQVDINPERYKDPFKKRLP